MASFLALTRGVVREGVLDDNVLLASRTSATISGNVLYYLSRATGDGAVAVRKLPLGGVRP